MPLTRRTFGIVAAGAVLAAAALSFALPAQADPINFEDVTPNIFGPGDSFVSSGFVFTFDEGFGVVDTEQGFFFGNAPLGSDGQFLSVLNAGGVEMKLETGNPFLISEFEFGFIAPFPGVGSPGFAPGALYVTAVAANGSTFSQLIDFPVADADGNFSFGIGDFAPVFNQGLISLHFSSCVYDASNVCQFGDNLAQFALDNLVAQVPEPATLLLALLALGLLGVTRRRGLR